MSSSDTPADRSVVERTLGVLGAFDVGKAALTVSEISRRSGIPVATAYRIVSKLVSWGALERAEGNKYTIGVRLWEISLLAPRHSALREAAIPSMFELRSVTRCAVLLSVRDGNEGICLESVSGGVRPLHRSWSRGHRFPLHATACGRVLLSDAGSTVQEEIYAGGLRRYTDRTVTDPSVLRGLVEKAGRQGFAVSHGELLQGVVEIATLIRDGNGVVVGAVGLITGSETVEHVRRTVGPLMAAARQVSRNLDPVQAPRSGAPPTPARASRPRADRTQDAGA
ncbi:IclR family transcriptional regulator [Streptomyces sp. R28]|uniref:IclR family transcriptional regulator n=1 Tax=Streptomyces sp. R28 TaxID=3238628 RepID=A0AB39PSJ7_9ACTN